MTKHHASQPVCWKQSRSTRWQDARSLLTRWQGAILWLISQDEINARDLCGNAVARYMRQRCQGCTADVHECWNPNAMSWALETDDQSMCNVLNTARRLNSCDCDASWTAGENQGSNSVMRTELELVKTRGAFKHAMTRTLMATQPSGEQRCQSNVGT